MSIEIRPIVEGELEDFCEAVTRGFGGEVREGEHDRVRRGIGLERCLGAFDHRGRIVGTNAAYRLQLAVPGSVDVAAAGLTRVTVAASHRRQGILNSMMAAHFDAAAADEPLSALWASEVAIYGRYGYGQATDNMGISYDARKAKVRRPDQPDDVDLVDIAEAEETLPELRERCRLSRPGMFQRSPTWWELRSFPDHEWSREGGGPRRYVVAHRDGKPVGYAAYRHKSHWDDDDLPEGELRLIELSGIDDRAVHTLWWFLSNVDLFPMVKAWSQPVDSAVVWLAENPRAIRQHVNDGIFVRVLDVEAALAQRRYDSAGELVFAVRDEQRPAAAGTFRLTVASDGSARCARSDDAPQATFSAAGLGALYLGGSRADRLAYNGHLETSPGQVQVIRRLFAWPVPPFCDEDF